MVLYLMRHYEVDYKWKKKYTSEEFKTACKEYDESKIKIPNLNLQNGFKNAVVYISELKRSNATLKVLDIDNEVQKTGLINEVPIRPFVDTKLRLPLNVWMVMGRLQWLLNIKRQPETRYDTSKKIKELISLMEKEKRDILIIGHGFYFSYLKRFLKNRFSGLNKSIYKNGEIITLERNTRP